MNHNNNDWWQSKLIIIAIYMWSLSNIKNHWKLLLSLSLKEKKIEAKSNDDYKEPEIYNELLLGV